MRLTPTEWQLLEILVRNPGKLVSQRQLLHEVWGPELRSETHYLRQYMAQLRRKLEDDPSRPRTCSPTRHGLSACTSMRASSPARIDHRPSSARAAPTWSASQQAGHPALLDRRARHMCGRGQPKLTVRDTCITNRQRISESVGSP